MRGQVLAHLLLNVLEVRFKLGLESNSKSRGWTGFPRLSGLVFFLPVCFSVELVKNNAILKKLQ